MDPTFEKLDIQQFKISTDLDYTTPTIACEYGTFTICVKGHSKTQFLVGITVLEPAAPTKMLLHLSVSLLLLIYGDSFAASQSSIHTDQAVVNWKGQTTLTLVNYPSPLACGNVAVVRSIRALISDLVPSRIQAKPVHMDVLSMLNDPNVSDVALLPDDMDLPIHVSRLILSHGSVFYYKMFQGNWSEACDRGKPIVLNNSSHAVFVCLIHIYGGWLPGNDLPALDNVTSLMRQINLTADDLDYDLFNEVAKLAEMLELKRLAIAATRRMLDLLKRKLDKMED